MDATVELIALGLRDRASYAIAEREALDEQELRRLIDVACREILDEALPRGGKVDPNLRWLEFEIDGVALRGKIETECADDEATHYAVLEVSFCQSWTRVGSLADLGRVLRIQDQKDARRFA